MWRVFHPISQEGPVVEGEVGATIPLDLVVPPPYRSAGLSEWKGISLQTCNNSLIE